MTSPQNLPEELVALGAKLDADVWPAGDPVRYEFRIGGLGTFNWTIEDGMGAGPAVKPTCLFEAERDILRALLSGELGPGDALGDGQIRTAGLMEDIMALGRAFAGPAEQRKHWVDLLARGEPLENHSRRARLRNAERAYTALDELCKSRGQDPSAAARVREMVSRWADRRVENLEYGYGVKAEFPDLATQPWMDESAFHALIVPEAEALTQEAIQFHDGRVRAPHYGHSDPDAVAIRAEGWKAWNIFESFKLVPERAERFPTATRVLQRINEQQRVIHGGFLIMDHRINLPAHFDGVCWAVSHHFGLIVPPGCFLTVMGETRSLEVGKSLQFNDAYWHAAGNPSDAHRVVFVALTCHPDLTPFEQECIELTVSTLPPNTISYPN